MSKKSKLTEIQKVELVRFLEDSILRGEKRSDCFKKVIEEYKITANETEGYFNKAQNNIMEFTSRDIDSIMDAHVFFYEQIYKFFRETKNSFGIGKALSYKEKLIGLHREETIFEVNNTVIVEEMSFVEENYDFDLLKKPEKERLEFLLNKALRLKDENKGRAKGTK